MNIGGNGFVLRVDSLYFADNKLTFERGTSWAWGNHRVTRSKFIGNKFTINQTSIPSRPTVYFADSSAGNLFRGGPFAGLLGGVTGSMRNDPTVTPTPAPVVLDVVEPAPERAAPKPAATKRSPAKRSPTQKEAVKKAPAKRATPRR